jgi:IS5 family transposase
LLQFAGEINWDGFDGEFAPLYSENGRPGIETRFMIGLLLLKHIYGLSDQRLCERWATTRIFIIFVFLVFYWRRIFPKCLPARALGPELLASWNCC